MILGSVLALISALSWGAGDFFGGLSTRRFPRYAVLGWMSMAGILALLACLLIWPEAAMQPAQIAWAAAGGLCGLTGLGLLYAGLAGGHAATVAPTAAVIGAALPVAYGFLQGAVPGPLVQVGFVVAMAGIALVSSVDGPSAAHRLQSLWMALGAGISFGCFYLFLSFTGDGHTFLPLVFSRSTVVLITAVLLLRGRTSLKAVIASPVVWLNGLFDAGGNVFYMLARQHTSLSVAVVLSSLYPAVTVLLSWKFLHEHINRKQWLGVICCFLAVVLITV